MSEFSALVELLVMLVSDLRVAALLLLLLVAAVIDCRTYRIPNWLTFGGSVFALVYSVMTPFTRDWGLSWALGGLLLGLLCMLPFYALRVMGAGDVKLMAMTGAFLGLSDIFYAVLFTFVTGGVAALLFAVFNRAALRMLGNIRTALQGALYAALGGYKPHARVNAGESVGKLPYGLSISVGTTVYLVARQLGYV